MNESPRTVVIHHESKPEKGKKAPTKKPAKDKKAPTTKPTKKKASKKDSLKKAKSKPVYSKTGEKLIPYSEEAARAWRNQKPIPLHPKRK